MFFFILQIYFCRDRCRFTDVVKFNDDPADDESVLCPICHSSHLVQLSDQIILCPKVADNDCSMQIKKVDGNYFKLYQLKQNLRPDMRACLKTE